MSTCLIGSDSSLPTPDGRALRDDGFRDLLGAGPTMSDIVQLAYEEYCRRLDAGERVNSVEFARRFGPARSALLKQIEVHHYLARACGPGEASPSPLEGRVVLGFELVEEIGRGAFSRVFVARDSRLARRRVVLKLCSFGGEEASTIALLAHPRIVPVLSVYSDEASGLTGICMPFLGRLTLQHVLDAGRGDHPVRTACRSFDARRPDEAPSVGSRMTSGSFVDAAALVAADVLSALSHIHAMGYCHGDVKPSNVLLATDGYARLLDFNLANGRASGRRPFGGTLDYMPPEQLTSVRNAESWSEVSHNRRTDLFCLGATLYHVLTGRPPFGRRTPGEPVESAVERILSAPPPASVRSLNPDVDDVFATAIHDCLSRDPAGRPVSASAVARLLARRH